MKYPTIFNSADTAILTKSDLADIAEFDHAAAFQNIYAVRPGMTVLEVSAKTGAGMDAWPQHLFDLRLERCHVSSVV